ncbi:MAG: hypothetical protein VX642_09330 [Bdellovibrionota bacterium]|nr:hypothetical protein [Bdellovibrionota bacterium]
MFRFLFCLHLIFISLTSFALDIEFYGPCEEKALVSEKIKKFPEGQSIGQLTISYLNLREIPYKGSEMGFNSIFGSPIGLDAIELVSDTEMYSYGWCYWQNGKLLELYPNQVLANTNDRLQWIFSYAQYKDGKWISQCIPAFRRKPKFLCESL